MGKSYYDSYCKDLEKIVGKTVLSVAMMDHDVISIRFTDNTYLKIVTSEWISEVVLEDNK